MINLRYHIVSITAVFLALAIGVVMGTSFLGKASVDQLKTQISQAERRIDATKKANSALATQIKRLEDRDESLREQGAQLLAEHLTGEPVLIIASAGADQKSLASLRSTLEATSADFKGTLTVTGKLRLADGDLGSMAKLLGLGSTQQARVRRILAARFATMLASAGRAVPSDSEPTVTSSTTTRPGTSTSTLPSTSRSPLGPTTTTPLERRQPTLLTDLRAGGWVDFRPPTNGSPADLLLTTTGYRYVMVSGPGAAVPDGEFLLPMLADLGATEPAPVVLASAAVGNDAEATRLLTVGPVRAAGPLNKNVSTVDDLESFDGEAAVVLALEDLAVVHGHYGVGKGATSLLPPPP